MPSPVKRRPGVAGSGSRGGSGTGPRSPLRPSRASPNTSRNSNPSGSNTNTSASIHNAGRSSSSSSSSNSFIAPPPRVALSGTSSPTSDNPRNTTTTTTTTRSAAPSPRLGPTPITTTAAAAAAVIQRSATRSPSPSPSASASAAAAAATTIAALQSTLRERDARVAALERELALVETEFHRSLDRLSSAESETAAFWQGKCAALEGQVAGLQRRLREVQGQRQGQEKREVGAGVRQEQRPRQLNGTGDGVRPSGEVVLGQKDDEIARLRAQIQGLKEWVSVSTRADGQVRTSDEVFVEDMTRLGNGLQNWVLVNFRRARVDLAEVDDDTISELARLVPMYEMLASTSKIQLLQSVVSRLLVELVFDAYFVGLPGCVADQIKQVETFLSSASSPESANRWRSLTLAMLKKDASEHLRTETSTVVDAVVTRVNKLLDPVTNTKSTDARDQGLQALATSAIELSQLLAVQKAVFKIEFPELVPHQRTMFDAEIMEDVSGEDEDNLGDRDICCVTFPGLTKWGDESGGHLQYRNVIVKTKVLCSPE